MGESLLTETVDGFQIDIYQDEYPENPRGWGNLGHMVCWHSRYNLGDEQRSDSQEDFFRELAEIVDDTVADRIEYWENGKGYKSIFNWCEREFPDMHWMDWPISRYVDERVMDIIDNTIKKYYIMLPLALYDHSGITMYVGSSSHSMDPGGWDSGQVGWIFVSQEQIRKEYGWKVLTKKRIEKIKEYLANEVKTYDQYLTGCVYGCAITERATCKYCGAELEAEIETVGGYFGDIDDIMKEVKSIIPDLKSVFGDRTCQRYKALLSALKLENDLFDTVNLCEGAEYALAGRLDARMGGGTHD